jgi:hypothetical protein
MSTRQKEGKGMKLKTIFSLAAIMLAPSFASYSTAAEPASLADTIEKIKPAIGAIGTFQKTRRRPGFFVVRDLLSATGSMSLPTPMSCRKNRCRLVVVNMTARTTRRA